MTLTACKFSTDFFQYFRTYRQNNFSSAFTLAVVTSYHLNLHIKMAAPISQGCQLWLKRSQCHCFLFYQISDLRSTYFWGERSLCRMCSRKLNESFGIWSRQIELNNRWTMTPFLGILWSGINWKHAVKSDKSHVTWAYSVSSHNSSIPELNIFVRDFSLVPKISQ